MNHKNGFLSNTLKNKVWLFFVVFTVLLVSLIWLLQTVFFEYNYQTVRGETMNIYAELISKDIKNGNQVSNEDVFMLEESSIDLIHARRNGNKLDIIYPLSLSGEDDVFINKILESVVSELAIKNTDKLSGEKEFSSNIIFYNITKIDVNGNSEYILLISSMSSAKDVIKVLRNQLIVVAVIVILISLFVSYFLAKKIAKPIDDMSRVAERWAKGDENVKFEGGYYSEMYELAGALNKAKEEINKSGNLQKDLLANVSHDLKTPLTMIKAYAEMIRDLSGDIKEKRDKHTQVIIDEADRLTLLVNDILNLSKIQSHSEVFEFKKVNVSKLVEQILYRFDAFVNEKGFKIESSLEDNVYALVDEKKIEEVIYNLIGNAINYTGEDKTIKVYLSKNGDKATLEILDSGVGIDGEKIETVWEKYYRYSETHKRSVKGTGLGLSIVKAILDEHNLEYGVLSKVGVGSNFYITFNLVEGESDE